MSTCASHAGLWGHRTMSLETQVVERNGIVPPALPAMTWSPTSSWLAPVPGTSPRSEGAENSSPSTEGVSGEPLSHPSQAQACPPPPNCCILRAQRNVRCPQAVVWCLWCNSIQAPKPERARALIPAPPPTRCVSPISSFHPQLPHL